ncbi:MAG: NAD-binding protein [marine benthic group bacterium]|nr:NAD-binding protein [Gemmatimonadota bacterium]
MKNLFQQIAHFLKQDTTRRNLVALGQLFLALVVIVAIYSLIFHVLMDREGQDYSWFTGVYWTLTVMSTLGFGDITFSTDLGRAFSMIVLMTGTVYLLILLPFSFIRFFYAPWMEAQAEARALRKVPEGTEGHVLLTHYDPVSATLIRELGEYRIPYYLIVPELADAIRMHDKGIRVVVGNLDDPRVYRRMKVDRATMVATTASDPVNTHVAFTVRELTESVPIVATADDPASADILELAGCSRVLQVADLLGQALARRMQGGDGRSHVIGGYGELQLAETTVAGTPMVGKSLEEIGLRRNLGLNVVGIWERGLFETARPETVVTAGMVLVLAGTREQLDRFDEQYGTYRASDAPTVIIGGGRVGRAVARTLEERGLRYRIVEQDPEVVPDTEEFVVGNAAELEVLKAAGIDDAPTAIITTHDDDINVYLTIYCRRLRPDIQIISRVALGRSISALHRAGADFVMSYASLGANAIFKFLERGDSLIVTEGLDVVKLKMPASLAGRTMAEAGIRRRTGCTVVALEVGGKTEVILDPNEPLPENAEIILIGGAEGQSRFLKTFT